MQPPAGGGGVQTKQPVVQQTSIGSDYDDSEPAPGEKESWPELVNLDCQVNLPKCIFLTTRSALSWGHKGLVYQIMQDPGWRNKVIPYFILMTKG